MKTSALNHHRKCGLTILEMTIVLLVVLSLVRVGLFTYKKMDEWKLARTASETLRDVYSAQRQYLSDNPTVAVTAITSADLLPYMSTAATTLPTVRSLTGTDLSININVSPPVINNSPSGTYDPSGNSSDSLWDVGE